MKILALDPARSTGYALVEVINNSANIYEYGIIDVDTSSEFSGDWCIDVIERVKALILKHQVTEVCVEDYFFSSKFATGVNVNAAFRTAIHIACRQLKIPYYIINISEWKKFVAGRSTPSKEQKKLWTKEAAKKIFIQDSLWRRWKFRFANHSISNKTGKPILFRFDIVDVVAQVVFHLKKQHNIDSVQMTVTPPVDVDFGKLTKQQKKKIYLYQEQ